MLFSILKFFITIFLVIVLSIITINLWVEQNEVKKSNILLQKELESKKEIAKFLSKANSEKYIQLHNLNTNIESAVEERARETFGMIQKDETFFYDTRANIKAKEATSKKEPVKK